MAASVVLNSYVAETGCLNFTITGSPAPASVDVEKSINAGATWTATNGSIGSPRCGFFSEVPILFRIRLQASGVVSNTLSFIGTGTVRTLIENETDISFCNSPIHIRLQNIATNNTIQSAVVKLFIWTGAQNQALTTPTHVLQADKVSVSDKYINFEISEYIKAFLINPNTAPNTNQPQFAYNQIGLSAVTGQGVFWQVVADVTSTAVTERFSFRTSFCTLGYRYQDEKVYSAILPDVDLWYHPQIHDYFKQSFNFTRHVSVATTINVIDKTAVTPNASWQRDSLDPYLIVFLNKLGLWQYFTPDGKAVIVEKKKMTTNNISYRDPSMVNTSYMHQKLTDNFDVQSEITINTGSLFAEMVETVRQIVLSPKVYLISFDGDLQLISTVGITIDNTFVTIDSTLTTIDGLTVTNENIALFKNHTQIPVVLMDTDFIFKTRLNDKNKIDYNLKFEKTTNSILDIR